MYIIPKRILEFLKEYIGLDEVFFFLGLGLLGYGLSWVRSGLGLIGIGLCLILHVKPLKRWWA